MYDDSSNLAKWTEEREREERKIENNNVPVELAPRSIIGDREELTIYGKKSKMGDTQL